jgi:hypothetical protein
MWDKPRCRVLTCHRPATHFTAREPHPKYASTHVRTVAYFCDLHAPQTALPIDPAAPPVAPATRGRGPTAG